MVDYLEIKIRNKHAIIKTVNDSNMHTIPFDKIKIIDENDRVLVDRNKTMKKIYLLTSDGHRDSLSLDCYAEDEKEIKHLVATEMKESFSKDVKDVVVDFDGGKIYFESRYEWESDSDDWVGETYHFLCIEKVKDE